MAAANGILFFWENQIGISPIFGRALVMNAWCALWFWPIDKVDDLPTRKAFLAAARLLLGDKPPDKAVRPLLSACLGFEINGILKASEENIPDVDQLSSIVPWFGVSQKVSEEKQFHHWALVFTEILGPKVEAEGFNLVVGNPPWVNIEWSDLSVLCEIEPNLGVKEEKSAVINKNRNKILQNKNNLTFYINNFEKKEGEVAYCSSIRQYPALIGFRPNLYKNFIVQTWNIIGKIGYGALLHPNNIFDDPKSGVFRKEYYKRLVAHYQLIPEFCTKISSSNFARLIFHN